MCEGDSRADRRGPTPAENASEDEWNTKLLEAQRKADLLGLVAMYQLTASHRDHRRDQVVEAIEHLVMNSTQVPVEDLELIKSINPGLYEEARTWRSAMQPARPAVVST